MVAAPAVIAFVANLIKPGSAVFFMEAAGVFVFGLYWKVKTVELSGTHADMKGTNAELTVTPHEIKDVKSAFQTLPVSELAASRGSIEE